MLIAQFFHFAVIQLTVLETNTVTPLIQRMEKQGLITRKQGDKDKSQKELDCAAT